MGSIAAIISAASSSVAEKFTPGVINAGLVGAQTGLGFIGHEQNAQAASIQGRFAADVAERNAQMAERQGRDALNRGSLEESRYRSATSQQIASGRAAAAASGVDISSGSAADVAANRQLIGDLDATTIRNNAALEAYGYDVEAANQRMQGRLANLAGNNVAAQERMQGVSTLLSGASSLYSLYRNRVSKNGTQVQSAAPVRAPDASANWRNKGYG